jgi:hypothetical protein
VDDDIEIVDGVETVNESNAVLDDDISVSSLDLVGSLINDNRSEVKQKQILMIVQLNQL